jgi:DUF1365 family protein
MHSRIYKGWVSHRRVAPTRNRFRYPLFMLYLDLAELPQLFDGVPFFSARRPALAWFRRADYLAPHTVSLDEAVRSLVAARTGARPEGPIRLLTHLRYFGYCMNPVSFYYCFDRGERLETIVADITNTPWKERHQYVLRIPASAPVIAESADRAEPAPSAGSAHSAGPVRAQRPAHRFEFDKRFHVSPFLPMDMHYRWSLSEPGEQLLVHMQNERAGEAVFDATLALEARPLTPRALIASLAAFPVMTLEVIAAIHWQALKLWLKRTPFYSHPPAGVLAGDAVIGKSIE